MTRNSASGRGSSRTLIALAPGANSTVDRRHARLLKRSAVRCLLLLMAPLAVWAQQGSDPQVHSAPLTPPADKTQQPPPDAAQNKVSQGTDLKSQMPNGTPASLRNRIKSYKTGVDLVLVNVTITDDNGRIVTGLDRENFEVYEADKKEPIQTFSSEDAPISLGAIFDESASP